MSRNTRVLIVEDLPTDAELAEREVRQAIPASRFLRVETREDFLTALDAFHPDLILSDFELSRFDGLSALRLAREHSPQIPFIILTGSMNEDTAMECMKAGAWDYVIKEHIKRLGTAALNGLLRKQLRTERKEAETALAESEELYRRLFHEHSAVKLIIDPNTRRIIDANEAAEKFYGWSVERLKRMRIDEINVLPVEEVEKAIEKIGTKKRTHFEFRHRRADGSVRDVEVFSSKIQAKGKSFLHSIIHDVTDRKKAEAALEESEQWFRTLADSTATSILIYQDDRVVYVNKTCSLISGFSEEELLKKHYWDIVHPEFRDMIRERGVMRQRGDSVPNRYEFKIVRKDGSIRWVDFTAGFITWKGRPAGLGTAIDVTSSREAREQLAKSEAEFRHLSQEFHGLLDAIPDSLMLLDRDLKVLWANKPAADGMGLSQMGIEGRNCHVLWYGLEDSCDQCPVRKSFASGKPQSEIVKSPDGRLWDIRTVPLSDEHGDVGRVIELRRDITEQRKMEEQFRQAQKAEAIGNLAGGVAHDFNNMLSVILGYGENLLNELHRGDPLREDVKEIVEAGRRSASLTRQLLAFSRRQTLQPERVNLNCVVGNLEKMLRRLIGEDIDLDLRLAEDLAPVMADPGQIEQVIMNLVVNARDAMPEGGNLIIGTSEVDLGSDVAPGRTGLRPGRYVLLSVIDTGSGMDENTLSNIFEPFFTTKEKGRGTGLGLSTVYGIVKQSEGDIRVHSEPGRGSTFEIYLLPADATSVERAGRADESERRGGGEHILVVEDEQPLRGLFSRMLVRLGYRVTASESGGEALLLVERQGLKPDLLITDVVMPGMSGSVLAERLRKRLPSLKVLYMSGYTDDAIVRHGVLDPNTPFLQKPFNSRDLSSKVRELLPPGK